MACYCVAASICVIILICPISVAGKLVCLGLTLLMLGIEHRHAGRFNTHRVISFSASGIWSYHVGDRVFRGSLGTECYRCRVFVVLALISPDARTHYIMVPRDSTDSRGFSLLQTHLKFPSHAAAE